MLNFSPLIMWILLLQLVVANNDWNDFQDVDESDWIDLDDMTIEISETLVSSQSRLHQPVSRESLSSTQDEAVSVEDNVVSSNHEHLSSSIRDSFSSPSYSDRKVTTVSGITLYETFYKHFLQYILSTFKYRNSLSFKVDVEFSETDLDKIETFLTRTDKMSSMNITDYGLSDIDEVLTSMFKHIKSVNDDHFEGDEQILVYSFSSLNNFFFRDNVFNVELCVIVLNILITSPILFSLFSSRNLSFPNLMVQFLKLLFIAFAISIGWNYIRLYKSAVSDQLSANFDVHSSKVCYTTNNPADDLNWVDWFHHTLTKSSSDEFCRTHRETLLVHPIWKVSPLTAVSETVSQLFITPVERFGEASGKSVHKFLSKLSYWDSVVIIPCLLFVGLSVLPFSFILFSRISSTPSSPTVITPHVLNDGDESKKIGNESSTTTRDGAICHHCHHKLELLTEQKLLEKDILERENSVKLVELLTQTTESLKSLNLEIPSRGEVESLTVLKKEDDDDDILSVDATINIAEKKIIDISYVSEDIDKI